MESRRDKTKATHFNQLGTGAGRFFCKPRQFRFFLIVYNPLEFDDILQQLNYAE